MIVPGAENANSIEVDDTFTSTLRLFSAPLLAPDERWGERVHAVVVVKSLDSLDAETLKRHCREWIADYKCPRSFEFQTDPLPLSGAGKVLKKVLRERC